METLLNDFSKDEIDQFFEYLDELRGSGETNMYGASSYLMEEFGLTKQDSRRILSVWMNTFEERHVED